ncbi:MAG TPA: vWA domain-containing protein, partial [Gemmataceae bacterium]|nr:vWA domain-containing protein [Gemmataceae bacterium]
MNVDYLQRNWLALVLLMAALGLGARLFWIRWRQVRWSFPLVLAGSSLLLVGAGGLGLLVTLAGFEEAPRLLAFCALGTLAVLFLIVILTGTWIPMLGYIAGAVLCIGLGGWFLEPLTLFLGDAAKFLLTLTPLEPWWLLLLILLPLIVAFSFRSLSGLGQVRRWVAIGLRCLVIALIALALAETHARKQDENLTVLFVWDRSLSIPPEQDREGGEDLRKQRLMEFINQAVAKRGPGKAGDRAGVIVFGRRPRLELPPASVPELRFTKINSPIDDSYTDIASAIKLALASFPEGTAKRIVLISDGNENIGQAEEQARIARQNGVQIDVVPLAAGNRNPNEVLVERVEVPPQTDKDTRLPIRIVLRSFHPDIVVGSLQLTKTSLDMINDQPVFEGLPIVEAKVKLVPGINVRTYEQPGSKKDDAYTYEAKFVPLYVENARGKVIMNKLPGDRVENNRASASVMTRGERALLVVEPRLGDHKLFVDRLQKAKPSLKIVTVEPKTLPQDPARLAIVLARFDGVVLANIPADELTDEQQKVFRANTHDQGAGLIVIGGPQSFGAGGWQGSELEKAMPVTSDLKSIKVEGKSGLVQIMHASEMAEGNAWQRKIAKLAIEKLSPMDMVGVSYWDHQGAGGASWHIPFQEIGNKRAAMIAKLNDMMPGDMPDADPFFIMAYKELTNPAYGLGTKHIIFISDGDHWGANPPLLAKVKAAKITCTTVCITTHGAAEVQKMALVAKLTGGRSYHIKDPSELPAIYIKESRLVSQSFVFDKKFAPRLVFANGPTEGMKGLEDLYGFVRTTRRPSPLVEVPIETPQIGEAKFPILAYWQYGLGKSVAFTSDARSLLREKENFWDKDWASSDMYIKFWEQTVEYVLRAVDTGKFLHLSTEQRDGKVRVIIEANDSDADKTPLTNIKLKAGVMSPTFKGPDTRKVDIEFEQKSAGVYEGEFPADEVGSYFLNIQA